MRPRTRFQATSNAYVERLERRLRGLGDRVKDPDYALAKDPEFWEAIDVVPAIKGARQYRQGLVAGDAYTLEAPTDYDAALIPYVSKAFRYYKGFRTARRRLADADLVGRTTERLFGETRKLDLLGDGTEREWYLITGSRPQNKQRWELKKEEYVDLDGARQTRFVWAVWHLDPEQHRGWWDVPDNPEKYIHHVVDDAEDTFGYGGTMARPLYWLADAWLILDEARKDICERYGSPWIEVDISEALGALNGEGDIMQAYSAIVDRALSVAEQLRRNSVLIKSEMISVKLVEANLQGANLVNSAIDDMGNQARILILGSNLPTSATEGGSYSLADIQDESTRRLISASRDVLDDTLTDQLVARWVRWNAPTLRQIPHPTGRGTLADCAAPWLSVRDEEVTKPDEEERRFGIAERAGLEVREEDVRSLSGFPAPADKEASVKLGGGGQPAAFNEQPSWWKYTQAF